MAKTMNTPENITELKPNQVIVVSTNLAGYHGAGAALTARQLFGLVLYECFGHFGQTFAIPTKDYRIKTLSLEAIEFFIKDFLLYAIDHPEIEFLVTKIGCGLAGYKYSDIAPFFKNKPENVILPYDFELINNE